MDKKEQTRLRVKRYRNRKALPDSVTLEGAVVTQGLDNVTLNPGSVTQSPESVTQSTDSVTLEQVRKFQEAEGVTDGITLTHHPVMKWLIPGEKRKKMELIVESLRKHNQLRNVSLGCGKHSLPLDIVGEMLECTR